MTDVQNTDGTEDDEIIREESTSQEFNIDDLYEH